jgi:hypothetical protein
MRLEKLLVKGWMQRASGGTEIAGRNGGAQKNLATQPDSRTLSRPPLLVLLVGMEWTCGRLLYYDGMNAPT